MTLTDRYLRRLRLSLTALFSVATFAALGILVFVALRIDNDLRWANMSETLLTRAQEVGATIYFEDNRQPVADRFLADETLTGGWPQSWVYEIDGDEVVELAGPDDDWYGLPVDDLAARVAFSEVSYVDWVGHIEGGSAVYGRGVPLIEPESGTPHAVAVTVVQEVDFFADHETLRTRLYLAWAALTAAAAAAGYWMAGRGTAATAGALAQQERLLSDAAHELRTPFAQIRAVAESGLAGDEPTAVALGRVAILGEEAGQMVDDMLVLARMEAGAEPLSTEPLRLDLLVEEVASTFDDVTLETVETIADGDAGLLRRAVSNLVRNAVAHGGMDVKVTVYPTRVIVTDRGPGIEPGLLPHLFDRFHTGTESRGHGLGLPIVRWIADAHDGEVHVVNRDGGGTEAVLDLG